MTPAERAALIRHGWHVYRPKPNTAIPLLHGHQAGQQATSSAACWAWIAREQARLSGVELARQIRMELA